MNKICLDATELKSRYLFGITLKDKLGNVFPDANIQEEIDTAVDEFQAFMCVRLAQTRILCNPTPDFRLGWDYDEKIDPMSVYNNEAGYGTGLYFFKKRLPITPINTIQRFAWKLGLPADKSALEFPISWCKYNARSGLVQVRPIPGVALEHAILSLTYGGFYLPFITNYHSVIPGMLEVDYLCGYARTEATGTVAVAAGGTTVTGTGTSFKNVRPGNVKIYFEDGSVRSYFVKTIVSDTSLVLADAYAGTSAYSGAFFVVDRNERGLQTALKIIGYTTIIAVFHVLSDAIRFGISSESWSVDGHSGSTSYTANADNPTLSARINQYRKELFGEQGKGGLIENWRQAEKGIEAEFI